MRQPKIDDATLLTRLTEVFREQGFEGASLTRLVEATGLQRASLYHRFPGGKIDIAQAVLGAVGARLEALVLAPLTSSGDPMERVRRASAGLREFYRDGTASCLLDALSFGGEDNKLRTAVRASFDTLGAALAKVARDAGLTAATARRRARDAMVRIQGSLVFARGTGDTTAFRQTLAELPALLTEA